MLSRGIGLVVLTILTGANMYCDVLLSRTARQIAGRRERPLSSYSFLEDDRPLLFPGKGAKQATRMSVEESVHYTLLDAVSSEEWLWISTVGDGDLRLGPAHRVFGVGMTHQQHCLYYLFDALQAPHLTHGAHAEHPEHCLNHLRQYVLCDADITLEPADVLARNWTVDRQIGQHRCVDWMALRAELRTNWRDWKAVRSARQKEMTSSASYDR